MAIRVCIYRYLRSWQVRINDPTRSGPYFNKAIFTGRTAEEVQSRLAAWAEGKEIEVSYFNATEAKGDIGEGERLKK